MATELIGPRGMVLFGGVGFDDEHLPWNSHLTLEDARFAIL